MDKKLLGTMSFASVAVVAILSHQSVTGHANTSPILNANSGSQHVPIEVASANDNVLAYSTIIPAFLPNTLPVANITDVAAQSALQHKAASEGSSNEDVNDRLFDFGAVLQPDGFVRPEWQDIGYDVNFNVSNAVVDPFIVMIDPGHGGSDPGTKGHNGLLEKYLTLDIARRVRLFLTEFDHIEVRLTRSHDYGLSRQARVDAINRSAADIVISLHFNHLPQSEVNLVESYYASPANVAQSLAALGDQPNAEINNNLQRTSDARVAGADLNLEEGSERLATTLQRHVYSQVSFDDNEAQNAGVKQETLFVLTRSFTPAALIEVSCLSHPAEANRLMDEDYRNRLAAALVDGIRSYHDSLGRAPLKKRGDIDV